MSDLLWETPSGKTRGSAEGNKSSLDNSTPEVGQSINQSAKNYLNLIINWQIKNGFDKHLSLNTASNLYIAQIKSQARRLNPFKLDETPDFAFRAVQSAYWKTLSVIENLHWQFEEKNCRGDL